MKVISLISQKGGSGKTVTTVSLAVAAERSGRSAAIVDLDSQGSATSWSARRRVDTPVVVASTPARLARVLSAAENQGADLILIDTPPRAEQAARAAAKMADLVVIPCRPSVADLETLATTVTLVRSSGDRRIVIMLNGVPPRSTRREQAKEVVESMGLLVCPSFLGNRVAFDHASTLGKSAQEYEPRGKAAEEIIHVYKYISTQV